ncbi:hypothetical protein B0T26DRAFT_636243 [Lasiosphaeria miniovina]|uniref:Uncharacterized protein n=1 Tax=Lasiosphaeria miniovina TaxID=1954250 RepID=A0AA40B5N0_9PEZI|nr:uncharacterized protein B0T26DRAFT_636243 [Lasiosphaeria miniovina]KAK0728079.1 hypothetical protein B0T26DRAFT_636243 [Lasiosphaeria miniovina]
MCRYYAHAFVCKHVTHSFASFCKPASMIQTACGERHIWQTIRMDEACDECKAWYSPPQPAYVHAPARRTVRR